MVREILNNMERIKDWTDYDLKLSVQLEQKKSRDEVVEYLRYLAWKKVDYNITEAQFENAKDLFKKIIDFLHEKKDYITLGYFVYYTQYFYYKEIQVTPSPKKTEEKKETKEKEEEQVEEDEEVDLKNSSDDLRDLLIDNEEEESSQGNDKENQNSTGNQLIEKPVEESGPAIYHMMVDLYFTYDFAKDKEFWSAMLHQIFNVILFLFIFLEL